MHFTNHSKNEKRDRAVVVAINFLAPTTASCLAGCLVAHVFSLAISETSVTARQRNSSQTRVNKRCNELSKRIATQSNYSRRGSVHEEESDTCREFVAEVRERVEECHVCATESIITDAVEVCHLSDEPACENLMSVHAKKGKQSEGEGGGGRGTAYMLVATSIDNIVTTVTIP